MAVTKKGAVIAIWVICGVLVVAVIAVLIALYCRREKAKARRRYLAMMDGGDDSSGKHHHHHRQYQGFRRLPGVDLCTDPSAGTYPGPRTVNLRRLPNNTTGGVSDLNYRNMPCDILVNAFYVDRATTPPQAMADLRTGLLGDGGQQQSYYSSAFLLYTAPLEFIAAGTYVIQAHTINAAARVVGQVHQFVFNITAADGSGGGGGPFAAIDTKNPFGLGAVGFPGGVNHNEIEVSVSRNAHGNPQQQQQTTTNGNISNQHGGTGGDGGAPPPLLPPTISPTEGSVTTRTLIVITPSERSTTADQLRYSVDGSFPSVLYTGPFTLALPPESVLPQRRLTVTIRAIAVLAYAASTSSCGVSDVSEAVVTVRPAGYSFHDPQVPAPTMRLRAADASLYFDEAKNPPSTVTAYQLLYVNVLRKDPRKAKYSRRRCVLYEGTPVPIGENVAMVHAWTIDQREWSLGSSDNSEGLVDSDGDGSRGGGQYRMRSVATVYDCARASAEQAKPSKRRASQLAASGGGGVGGAFGGGQPFQQYGNQIQQQQLMLPAPVLCVSCAEMEIEFDAAPANSIIAYTLNDTEPALYDVSPPACAVPVMTSAALSASNRRGAGGVSAKGSAAAGKKPRKHSDDNDDGDDAELVGDDGGLHTFRYEHGARIRVTLLESEGVHVTARIFVPIAAGEGGGGGGGGGGRAEPLLGYRYGNVFHRGFFFSD